MRRRHRRLSVSPELDITAFLNLMIVLVPVLLLGMVFSQVRMIELNFPGMDAGEAPAPEEFRLVVTLIPEGIEDKKPGSREDRCGSGSRARHRLPDTDHGHGYGPFLSGCGCGQRG